jgi:hypothetical protein
MKHFIIIVIDENERFINTIFRGRINKFIIKNIILIVNLKSLKRHNLLRIHFIEYQNESLFCLCNSLLYKK